MTDKMTRQEDVAGRLDFLTVFLSEALGIPKEEIGPDSNISQLVGYDENKEIAVILGLKWEHFFGPYPFKGSKEYTLAEWAELASDAFARARREQRRRGCVKSTECRA